MSSRATIEEVASAAGVSRSTVSRVVNGSTAVSAEALDAVHRAIEELSYVPNRAARSLASRQTHAIALIVPEASARVELTAALRAPVRRGSVLRSPVLLTAVAAGPVLLTAVVTGPLLVRPTAERVVGPVGGVAISGSTHGSTVSRRHDRSSAMKSARTATTSGPGCTSSLACAARLHTHRRGWAA